MGRHIHDEGSDMSERPVKAVFFDWDHTLAYIKTPQRSLGGRLAMMFQIAGLPYTQEDLETALQQYAADGGQDEINRFGEAQTRREIASLYAHLLNYLGHQDTSWDLLVSIYRAYAKLPWVLFEESRAVLQAVRDKGCILGIISNTSMSALPSITQLVGDLVPARHIIISEEIGVHKPAKTIYLRAAARVRTPAANCLLVGDNLPVDAVGAVQNGGFGHAVWLDSNHKSDGRLLPAKISTITSLLQLIDMLDDCP
jgi:FMN phosphatase YigB (HAD superfamily)